MNFITIGQAKKQAKLSYLGSVNKSAKLAKNGKINHQYTYGMYLAPSNESGYNVCSHSTPECRLGCLATSGRAGMELIAGKTKTSGCRIRKTRLFYEQPEFFMDWLISEIEHARKKAIHDGYYYSVRLNCTSDIDWQNVKVNGQSIFEIFPDIQFYDYTKNPAKFNNIASNYHLTFSYTGRNWLLCKALLKQGFNVAMVFNVKNEKELPAMYKGYPVINGDLTDYRVIDGKGIIVGLKWKHIANKIAEKQILQSCFVVNKNDISCKNASVKILEPALV
jgi:hypothetical protein